MDVFVARQPIFDAQQRLYGYELLFRSGIVGDIRGPGSDAATAGVLDASFGLIGIEAVTGGKRAFVTFTRDLLLRGIPQLFPSNLLGVQILEPVTPDAVFLSTCVRLKSLGYLLVLGSFAFAPQLEPLLRLADVVRVDLPSTPAGQWLETTTAARERGIAILAGGVETHATFRGVRDLGFSLFEGHFFSKPALFATREVPTHKLSQLRLLKQISDPNVSMARIAEVVRADVALSYRLLRLVNSALLRRSVPVTSIKEALMLVGLRDVRKWASLVVLREIAQDRPEELARASLVRARFGELLAPRIGLGARADEVFLMEILSLLPALVGRPMEEAIRDLPLAPDIRAALLGHRSRLRVAHELIVCYERALWTQLDRRAAVLKLPREAASECYLAALTWTTDLLNEGS